MIFLSRSDSFAGKKQTHMLNFREYRKRRRSEDFEALCRIIIEAADAVGPVVDFRQLCAPLKTSAVVLDNMMYAAAGMSGDEVLARLRRRKPSLSD